MGKGSIRMDAGSSISAGVLIGGAALAQADVVAVPPLLPLLRRWHSPWSSPTTEGACERLKTINAPTPGGRVETTALLRLAATF
jgi:hypothetical protein